MISITISTEQIRTAPADVRKWIEAEVTASLGLQLPGASSQHEGEGLAVCSSEELSAVLSIIQPVLPAVNVFFELSHQGVNCADGQLQAYRLADLLQRTRLRNVDQVVACLNMINQALQRVRGTAKVSLFGLDGQGHCFVAAQTQQNIRELWTRLVDVDQIRLDGPHLPQDLDDRGEAADGHRLAAQPASLNGGALATV